jgi:chemotaxis protein CheD
MIVIGHKDGSIEKTSAVRFTQKTKGFLTHTVIGGEFAVGSDLDQIMIKIQK